MAVSYLRHNMKRAHGRVLSQVRGLDFSRGVLEVYKVSFAQILNTDYLHKSILVKSTSLLCSQILFNYLYIDLLCKSIY